MNHSADQPQRSIGEILSQAQQQLTTTSESPRLDAEVLLTTALGVSRAQLFARPELQVPQETAKRFQKLLTRRLKGEPIAHIVGQREFWSLSLMVSAATLIPRPDTERLVELALERIPTTAALDVVDLGTGTGAIALAIASECPDCRVTATDMSAEALAIAQRNATTLGLAQIQFRQGDWYRALELTRYDLILSNPPYIRADDPHLTQGDVRFDPRVALVSGDDGLTALRSIVAGAPQYLRPGGWLLVEHGYDQAHDVAKLFAAAGFSDIGTMKDLAGQPRVCVGRL